MDTVLTPTPLAMHNAMLPMSRASPAPPDLKRGSHAKALSPPSPPLKLSYSQIVKTKIPPHDPEKRARDPGKVTRDSSRDPLPIPAPHDQSHDLTRSCDLTRPRDPTHFGRATRPLINIWKTMGINQLSTRSKGSQGIPQGIPHSLSPMDTGTDNTIIGLRA